MTTAAALNLLELQRQSLSMETRILKDEPMALHTTFRVGGTADWWVEPGSMDDLQSLMTVLNNHQVPRLFFGRGTNVLVRDGGVRAVVIALSHPCFSDVLVRRDRLDCGAGARLKTVAIEARRSALSGLEFLEGIPGSVGGAVRMNAGAMGSCLFDVLEAVKYLDTEGQICTKDRQDLQVRYRSCDDFQDQLVLSVTLKAVPMAKEKIAARMRRFSEKRWSSQPAAPSAGCVFKNPEGIAAGRLVDELGLKGLRVGGAAISEVHGNFVVNEGGATASDILQLVEQVRELVRAQRGIDLEPELQVVGEDR